MLRKITMGLQSQKAVISRLFTTTAMVNHGEYVVASAVPAELRRVVELRARELWSKENLSQDAIDMEHSVLVGESEKPYFCCIVAVKNDGEKEGLQNVAPPLYGALDLMVNLNAGEALPLQNVPEEWRPDPKTNSDAYITNLVVEPLARRRLVATNLLQFAKDLAKAKGMNRIYVETGANNKAVVDLNKKAGFEVLSRNEADEAHGIVMGHRLM